MPLSPVAQERCERINSGPGRRDNSIISFETYPDNGDNAIAVAHRHFNLVYDVVMCLR